MSLDAGPAATDGLRRRNTALVLRLLRDSGSLSRADLARRSGLAKATVGTIVGQLQRSGAVTEGHAASTGRGRPSTPLVLAGGALAGLGIEVNVDYMAVTAVDLAGRELSFEERPVHSTGPTLEDVITLVTEEVARLEPQGARVLGLTIAVPGLIDRARGVVVAAPNLGWSGVPRLTPSIGHWVTEYRSPSTTTPTVRPAPRACTAWPPGWTTSYISQARWVWVLESSAVARCCGVHTALRVRSATCRSATTDTAARADAPGAGKPSWPYVPWRRQPASRSGHARTPCRTPNASSPPRALTPTIRATGQALARGVALLTAILDPGMIVLGGSFVPLGELIVPVVEEAVAKGFAGGGCTVALQHARAARGVDRRGRRRAGRRLRRSSLPVAGLTVARKSAPQASRTVPASPAAPASTPTGSCSRSAKARSAAPTITESPPRP